MRLRAQPPHLLADEELMARVADTDAKAFSVIYDRHVDAAYSLAYRICGGQGCAEDVVQEAFLSVWRSAGQYRPALGSVRSWLLTVVHNRAVDEVRRLTRHDEHELADEGAAAEREPAAADTEQAALGHIADDETHALVDELPVDQRRVIELGFYSGFSHSEIADQLDIPLGTVKGRMRLALDKLRDGALEKDLA